MVTSTVQHVRQTRPLSLPSNITNAKMFAKEAMRHTMEATRVRKATSFNLDAFQFIFLEPVLSLKRGRTKNTVIYKLIN